MDRKTDSSRVHLLITDISLSILYSLTLEDGYYYCLNLHMNLRRVTAGYCQSLVPGWGKQRTILAFLLSQNLGGRLKEGLLQFQAW